MLPRLWLYLHSYITFFAHFGGIVEVNQEQVKFFTSRREGTEIEEEINKWLKQNEGKIIITQRLMTATSMVFSSNDSFIQTRIAIFYTTPKA